MSRMLRALQQIEVDSSQAQQDLPPRPHQTGEVAAIEAAIEAALVRAETAVAAADNAPELHETPPPEPAVDEALDGGSGESTQQYQELAENILSQLLPGSPAVLMFTSPDDGSVQSATVAALARTFGRRITGGVLAVDCNLREPALAGRFAVQADRGLADVLLGGANWPDVVCKPAQHRVSVLPGRKLPRAEEPLPEGLGLKPLLDELKHHYPLILLDPPAPASPEMASIVPCCDRIYLLVRLRRTPRRAARLAIGKIQSCGGQVSGCVLITGPA